jgi:hypothetical protein
MISMTGEMHCRSLTSVSGYLCALPDAPYRIYMWRSLALGVTI